MSELAAEACLLFLKNQTAEWIMEKSPSEQERLIRESMKQTPHIKALFKERSAKLNETLQRRLQEMQNEKAAREEKIMREKENLVAKVEAAGGLWKTEEEVEAGVKRIKESVRGEGKKQILDALKHQISYRRKILLQSTENAKDWTFSENGKPLPIAGLKVKLIHLLTPYSINDRPENEEWMSNRMVCDWRNKWMSAEVNSFYRNQLFLPNLFYVGF